MSFGAIIDQIRDEVADLQDPHLLVVKQDLRNIMREFHLDPSKRHPNDVVSVETWVKKVQSVGEDFNPIIYYKAQGEVVNDSRLNDEDILLIISTPFQKEMLKKFGNDIVCTDSTHGMNQYDFHLTTLVVVDEYGSGVPGAFCISNKKNAEVFKVCYEKLREKIGTLTPNVFMTDDDESFYNAWKEVMGKVKHRLLCTWHIDRAWRKNLQSKIKNVKKRDLVYKSLRVLLQTVDCSDFESLKKGFIVQILNDPDTKLFGEYFIKYYVSRADCWAYCYRRGCGINTNMRLESLHKILKYIYLDGKKNKRLDKCIDVLMKAARDILFQRFRKLLKHQRPSQVQNILKSHLQSKTVQLITPDSTDTGRWLVQSCSNEGIFYSVTQNLDQIKVCDDECLFICEKCNPKICIHTFSCECVDHLIKNNICKHIHACVTHICDSTNDSNDCNASSTIKENVSKTHNVEEVMPFFENVNVYNVDNVSEITNTLEAAIGYLKTNSNITPEDAVILKRKGDQILDIVTKKKFKPTEETTKEPANKKIKQQLRFKSTNKNKENSRNSSRNLVKPSTAETINITQNMMHPETSIINISTGSDHTYAP